MEKHNPQPDPFDLPIELQYSVEHGPGNKMRFYKLLEREVLQSYIDFVERMREATSYDTPNGQRQTISSLLMNRLVSDPDLSLDDEIIVGNKSVYITTFSGSGSNMWLLPASGRIHGRIAGIDCIEILHPNEIGGINNGNPALAKHYGFGAALVLGSPSIEYSGDLITPSPELTISIPMNYEGQNILKRIE